MRHFALLLAFRLPLQQEQPVPWVPWPHRPVQIVLAGRSALMARTQWGKQGGQQREPVAAGLAGVRAAPGA